MLRINLLRHLPGPETPVEPPRGGAGKRLLGLLAVLAAVALIAGAAWFFYASPYKERFAREPRPVAERPASDSSAAPSGLTALDSARLALEARALEEIAAQQAAALRLSRALEPFLPGSPGARPVARAVLTAPAEFLLRGEAASPEALSRLQESLVLVPGLDLARSAARDKKTGRGLEFIFAGTVSPDAGTDARGEDSTFAGAVDSARLDSLASDSAAARPAPPAAILGETALDSAWNAFLEQAATAGLTFTVLPAAEPTAAGNLRTHAYRVQVACAPAALRAFLEGPSVQGSAFGIRRISWEINSGSRVVSLDIMAFSRR